MIAGVVDTTVIVHYFRKEPGARAWVDSLPGQLGIMPITWLEVMHGAPGKNGQATCKAIMSRFDREYLTPADFHWAMEQMERYRLSHGIGIADCLIASVPYRLQVPLYTHNLKHMNVLLDTSLVMKPY